MGAPGGLWEGQRQGVWKERRDWCVEDTSQLTSSPCPSHSPPPPPPSRCPPAFLEHKLEGADLSTLVLVPWSLPVYTRTSFSLLPCPWGTGLKMRASETSSGQGTPGDQGLLLLSWGYVEGDSNLAILGQTPKLDICSNLKLKPNVGRHATQATRAGRR